MARPTRGPHFGARSRRHRGFHRPPRMSVPDTPECLACGACCFSTLPRFVRVTGDDHARLGERAEELVLFIEHRAYMRLTDGHCAALHVDGVSGQFVCSVYAERPALCRELDRGGPACKGERATKESRPLLALRLVR